jgi:hypothetical protein
MQARLSPELMSACPRRPRNKTLRLALLTLAFFSSPLLLAQMSTGILTGTLRDAEAPVEGAMIVITSDLGFQASVKTDARGTFLLTLPYGRYKLTMQNGRDSPSSPVSITIEPLQNQDLHLTVTSSGNLHIETQLGTNTGAWAASASEGYPTGHAFAGLMLDREPTTAAQPLNYSGLGDNRLAWQSQRGFSWTGTQFKLLGMDATDSLQPGQPGILPNVNSLDEIVARSGFAQTTSSAYGGETNFFPSQPAAAWHGAFSTNDAGAALTSSNLPPPADRGTVQQNEQYRWFTRDMAEAGGALTKWADLFVSLAGQWSSQTVPIATPENDLHSQMLFGDTRLRIQGPRDQFDLLYSGSRDNLSNWGMPGGLEVLAAQRISPSFVSPYGFQNLSEADQFNFLQAGWSHVAPDAAWGTVQARYQYSVAHLDTTPINPPLGGSPQSRIDLLGINATGVAPLANDAAQTRQQANAFWQPSAFHALKTRHQIVAGFGFETSSPINRFSAPSDMNNIAAAGAPAFVEELNTPSDSRSIIRTSTLTFSNHITLGNTFSLDIGAVADFSRGSLPAQTTPAGSFAPERAFAAQSDLIAWNNISPRAGFAWLVPHGGGLVVRATYFRVYVPLTGRYLDFGNPNSLGGSEYKWIDRNGDGLLEAGELGPIVQRFGGPYSSIAPSIERPYADEFDVGAQIQPLRALDLSISFFRRDDKHRLAAINTGVPLSDFSPVSLADPGSDGIPGTFDDQTLTVYQQNPATFGQDHYLLTNPPDLRTLNKGAQADIRTKWRNLFLDASFVAEESFGPTNPGDAVFDNDPGVVGSLYMDPNALVNAIGRSFMDRAFVGKLQGTYGLPRGIEFAAIVDYNDGLVFARQLLVTGLAQGPFVIDATHRGTILNDPLSGNRAQGVINANLRLAREFRLPHGALDAAIDVLNVANSGYKIQENDVSGTSFNLRLPVEIQPARFARFELRYTF